MALRRIVRGAALSACVAAVLCVLALFAGLYPVARFAREEIDIHVHPDHVELEGRYYYRNPWPFPVTQGLSIPLPADATHPDPVQLSAEELAPRPRMIPLRAILGLHHFDIALRAHEEVCVRVRYDQMAPGSDARYILTTTQPWLHPLQSGVYRLIPDRVNIVSSNYPVHLLAPDTVGFLEKDFMPQRDWIFAWRPQ